MVDPYIAPHNITWMRCIYLNGNENMLKIFCLVNIIKLQIHVCTYTHIIYTQKYDCMYTYLYKNVNNL